MERRASSSGSTKARCGFRSQVTGHSCAAEVVDWRWRATGSASSTGTDRRVTARPALDTDRRQCAGNPRITYIPTDQGRSFLVVVIGLFSRQWVGWSMRAGVTYDIVIDAQRMGWSKHHLGKQAGLICHSDRDDSLNLRDAARLIEGRTVARATLCDLPPRQGRNSCPAAALVQPVSITPHLGKRQPMIKFENTLACGSGRTS